MATSNYMASLRWIAVSLLLFSNAALADTYLNVYGVSYHNDRSFSWNERNTGIGLRHDLNKHFFLDGGVYKDSLNANTFYLAVATKATFGPGAMGVSMLAMHQDDAYYAGHYRQARVIGGVLPFVSLETGRVTTNLGYIPRIDAIKLKSAWFMYWSVRISGTP